MTLGRTFALAPPFASGLANAASLESARRDTRVRRGRFSAIRGSAKLGRGNKIRTGRNGVARLVDPDGRSVGVAVNSLRGPRHILGARLTPGLASRAGRFED